MQYFQAIKIGKIRASKSQLKLFNISGFAMIVLTTKKINGDFFPVGEEELVAIIKTDDGYTVILVDKDGYTKTKSKNLKKEESIAVFKKLIDNGFLEFNGNDVFIWSNKYPIIRVKED